MIVWQPVYRCVVVVIVAALTLQAGCGKSPPSQPAAPPATAAAPTTGLPPWQPDPALVDQLGPYQDVEDYQISICPSRMILFLRLGHCRQVRVLFCGWARRAGVSVSFATLPTESAARVTLSEYLDKALAVLAKAAE